MAHGYSEAALRPMHDLDFLLEAHAFVPALDALLAAGWKPLRGSRASYLRRLKVFHALPVIGPDGVEIDLHRYMLEENCYPGADAPVFGRTRPGMAADLQITTLGAEDQIINSCVHGVRWDPVPPLRWALDAVMVVRDAGDSLDWDYLVQEARRRRVSLGVGAALDFVSRFEPSIPSQVVERLLEAPCGWLERWDFRFQQGGYSAPVQIGRYITRYLRLSAHRGPLRRAREFPTYLEAMWELDSPRQVPADGAKRVWKAIRR
jgi:hypothetical protein